MKKVKSSNGWDSDWVKALQEPKDSFTKKYKKFFSIGEIEHSKTLQWVFGSLLVSLFLAFSKFIGSSAISKGSFLSNDHLCWPYFQECGKFLFLFSYPNGYSQALLYTLFLGMLILTVLYIAQRNWVGAHFLTLILFSWLTLNLFVFSMKLIANFWYFLAIFLLILLLLPHKLFFLRSSMVLMYFLASTIKLHEGWILGTYFTSLQIGFPIFPDNITLLFTNLVIIMEMIGCWFLLSKNKLLQRSTFFFFVCFHLYSGIIVLYAYPVVTLPILLILFGPMNKITKTPFTKKSLLGWSLLSLLVILQLTSVFIPGDEKYTLEGNHYGLYMFEANHQCIAEGVVFDKVGNILQPFRIESVVSNHRCDPYRFWFPAKEVCKRNPEVGKISWTFDHSINGGPFYRIIEEDNLCALSYKPFSHNKWIKDDKGTEIIGYPVKNVIISLPTSLFSSSENYPDDVIVLAGLEGFEVPQLNYIQRTLEPHTGKVIILYWILWILILTIIIFYLFISFFKNFSPKKLQ